MLDTDVSDGSGAYCGQQFEDVGDEQRDVFNAIRVRADDYNGQANARDVLLVLELPVWRDKRLEPCSRSSSEQFAILDGRPTLGLNHDGDMPSEERHQLSWERLVNEDAHVQPVLRRRVPGRR